MPYRIVPWLREKLRRSPRSRRISYEKFVSGVEWMGYEKKCEVNGVRFVGDSISVYFPEISEKVRITYLDTSIEGEFRLKDILDYLKWKEQQKERSVFGK